MNHLVGQGAQFPEESVSGEIVDGDPPRRLLPQIPSAVLDDDVSDDASVVGSPGGTRVDAGPNDQHVKGPRVSWMSSVHGRLPSATRAARSWSRPLGSSLKIALARIDRR